MCLRAAHHGKVLYPIAGSRRLRTSRLMVSATAVASHCEIELLNLVCHRAHSQRQARGCGRCRTSLFQDTFLLSQVSWAGISRHMTVLLLSPLVAPLLTSKRRSTVEPGTCEDSLWPAMQHSCTACASSRIAILVSMPQMCTGTSLLLQLCLLRERAGLRPWTRVLFCPELRVLRLIPTVVQILVSCPWILRSSGHK